MRIDLLVGLIGDNRQSAAMFKPMRAEFARVDQRAVAIAKSRSRLRKPNAPKTTAPTRHMEES
jgi:hypothetical protein